MARITITTVERLEVHVFTEFSYDDEVVAYEPQEHDAWSSLIDTEGVEKHHYSLRGKTLSWDEADAIFSHGDTHGALTRRIQADFGKCQYDSMSGRDDCFSEDLVRTMDCGEMRQAWREIKSSRSEERSGDAK